MSGGADSDDAVRHAGLDVTVWSSDGKRTRGHLAEQGPPVPHWARCMRLPCTRPGRPSPDHSYYRRGGRSGERSAPTPFVDQVYQRADAFLFGRRTYEFFAGYWGVMDPGSGPIADALNTRPKYVASNTLTEPRWADTTVLSGDLAAAIGELKAKPGGDLQVLVESRAFPKGITVQVYRPAGRPQYAAD